jgi:hypothetical protein
MVLYGAGKCRNVSTEKPADAGGVPVRGWGEWEMKGVAVDDPGGVVGRPRLAQRER